MKSHVGRIFTKLGLRDRAAAVVYAFDHGIVVPALSPARQSSGSVLSSRSESVGRPALQ